MPKFSAFNFFGMMKFSSAPSRAELIYRSMYASKVDAFDMTKGGYQEAKTYAQAMGIARGRHALERGLNQQDPLKAIELLNQLEHDWVVIPSVLDDLYTRQLAVAARMILAKGSKRTAIEAGLKAIVGPSHFIALRTLVPGESVSHRPATANFSRPDLPFKVIQLTSPVVVLNAEYEVDYANADLTAGSLRILKDDILTVQPDNTGESEVIRVLSATSSTFSAIFTKAHDLGCFATTQNWADWSSTQRTFFVVVDAATSDDIEKVRRIDDFMGRVCKGTTYWNVVAPNSPTLGPFRLDNSKLGTTILELNDVFPPVKPFIGIIAPNTGTVQGGTSVVAFGINFASVSQVKVNNVVASFVTDTTTFPGAVKITFVTPRHSVVTYGPNLNEAVDVQITTDTGVVTKKKAFTYFYVPPVITSIEPTNGPIYGATGTLLHGSGFTGAEHVYFDGIEGDNIDVISDTLLGIITPPNTSGPANVLVVNPYFNSGTSGDGIFTYTLPTPYISSVNPTSGPTNGKTVIDLGFGITVHAMWINGTGFTEATSVTVNGVPAIDVEVASDTLITCKCPALTDAAHIGVPVAVVVSNAAVDSGSSGDDAFTYVLGTPYVDRIAPNAGPYTGGTPVVIYGNNLLGASVATIDGASLIGLVFIDDNTIIGTTIAGTAGPADVFVSNPSFDSGITGNGKYNLTV